VSYVGCEPVRVWNRLEVRPRQVELDQVLQARLHDPLWLLTRQWQFGEFHAEDSGSPVLATIARNAHPLDRVRLGSAPPQPYSAAEAPIEPLVEALLAARAPASRAQAGTHLLTLLGERLSSAGVARQAADDLVAAFRAALKRLYPLTRLDLDPAREDHALSVARRRSSARSDRVLLALSRGNAIDGVAFAQALPDGRPLTWNDVPGELAVAVPAEHATTVLGVLAEFRDSVAAQQVTPEGRGSGGPTAGAWDFDTLEYVHGCRVARGSGGVDLLGAPSSSGRVDWYSYDVAPGPATAPASGATPWDFTIAIPTPAAFAGMPSPRWWQFEDGAVSLSGMQADAGDLAKLLVQNFALVYGNNWLLVPHEQPVGTLCEVGGIVVDDVFGVRTLVTAATGAAGGDWDRWDLFSLSPRNAGAAAHPALGQHLFLPPALPGLVEGPVLEEVSFVRDEMSNMVWAVETRVPDGLHGSRDGANAARSFTATLAVLEQALHLDRADGAGGAGGVGGGEGAGLTYVLGTGVPGNWIPFLPVHRPSSTHAIRLQRASMPQFFPVGAPRVRPVTSILREGMTDPGSRAGRYPDVLDGGDAAPSPAFVNEEEVPRSGVVVRGRMQRGRWIGGTTVSWYGRQVTSGRGEGSSGLLFDVVSEPGQG
jgi:hypothetical protein